MADDTKSWWQTLPGILTAVAGVITAVTGFLLAMNQSGCFHKEPKTNDVVQTATADTVRSTNRSATTAITSEDTEKQLTTGKAGEEVVSKDSTMMNATTPGQADEINLLLPDNGGSLVAAGSDKWKETIDGSEDWVQLDYGVGQQAIYGFKDEKTVTFHSFAMLITDTKEDNIKEFELFAGNDSPTGKFTSLGKFTTTNMQLTATPYQVFSFSPVTAKYLKIKLISTWGWVHPSAYEFQLWGILHE